MRTGRPISFKLEEKIDEALELCKDPNKSGIKTVTDLCCHFDISRDTWYNAVKRHAEDEYISDAVKKMNAYLDRWWVIAGLSGKVNVTAWIFCMKNIFGWRDKQEIDNNINLPQGITVKFIKAENE